MMDRWLGTMLGAVHYVHSQSDDTNVVVCVGRRRVEYHWTVLSM